jgi:hypothetical protein
LAWLGTCALAGALGGVSLLTASSMWLAALLLIISVGCGVSALGIWRRRAWGFPVYCITSCICIGPLAFAAFTAQAHRVLAGLFVLFATVYFVLAGRSVRAECKDAV